MIANITINTYKQVEAAALPIAEGVATLVKILIGIGITCGIVDEAIDNQENLENLSDEELQELYNAEQQYLNDMKFYMVDGSFGSTANCSVMTADGSVLTLEEALDTATSMSLDDYMEMRKGSNSPTPSPGIDWGAIFIDAVSGGVMDFLASFLTDAQASDNGIDFPYRVYTGDSGYINRSTGQLGIIFDTDTFRNVNGASTEDGLSRYIRRIRFDNTVADEERKAFRMCVLLAPDTYSTITLHGSTSAYGTSYLSRLYSTSKFDTDGNAIAYSIVNHNFSTSYFSIYPYSSSNTYFYAKNWDGYADYALNGSGFPSYYLSKKNDYLDFSNLSTNLPIFTNTDDMENYLLNGQSSARASHVNPIQTLCNNYKNKVVTLTSVDDYGVTPTPTPSPTPKSTSIPTPSPTPTPSPYPTWDKSTGDNFTNYNFYTEVSNSFVNVQTTLNNISQSVTNIYNFFQIDTQEIAYEMDFDSPAYKFDSVSISINSLKFAFSEDTYDENTGILNAEYPKISMKCPKILEPIVETVGEDGKKEIVIVDFKDYALWFVRLRKFLEAILWIGMVFLLMKELKVVFTV